MKQIGFLIPFILCSSLMASEPARTGIQPPAGPKDSSKLFRLQYHISDPDFAQAGACVDFDNDGQRELLFASRKTKQLKMLNAADGSVLWARKLPGDQQSISAFDLDGDGAFEILYSVSGPGKIYLLDRKGNRLNEWASGDWKLGNSPVILDADGDGILDGFLGSRNKYLLRLDMRKLELISRRQSWSQCGCHTTAMDVDGDGRWDLFAGSGDDNSAKGVLHRYDPVSLKSVWSSRRMIMPAARIPYSSILTATGRLKSSSRSIITNGMTRTMRSTHLKPTAPSSGKSKACRERIPRMSMTWTVMVKWKSSG